LPAIAPRIVNLTDETAAPANRRLNLKIPAAVYAFAPPPIPGASKPQQADEPVGQKKKPDASQNGETSGQSGAKQCPGQKKSGMNHLPLRNSLESFSRFLQNSNVFTAWFRLLLA
jgi:hypothetical protein